MEPFRRRNPCPICEGHADLPTGRGIRCWGYLSDDGAYARCTREELAGGIERNGDETYSHRLEGPCRCGKTHGESHSASIPAERVVPIGRASREIEAVYPYCDADGTLLYEVVRFRPKDFRQRRPDGDGGYVWGLGEQPTVLYRWPEVRAAVVAGDTVYIVEGERDVEAIRGVDCVATCNTGGAGKWRPEFSAELAGAEVVIVADKDEPGRKHARQVFASLRDVAASVRVVEARTGKDAADHLAAGHRVDDFLAVWPPAELRSADPAEWKRRALREGLEEAEAVRELDENEEAARATGRPWPTGLAGYTQHKLSHLQGVVVIAGLPSAGKSLLAAGSAVDAATAGHEVVYVSCEMPGPVLYERLHRLANPLPETFHVLDVTFGVTLNALVDQVCALVTDRPLLVVFDSVSSFCDQVAESGKVRNEDAHGLALLKRIVMWAINARRATDGEIGFMLLAEASKEGRARGRFADHKADIALLMEREKASDLKTLTVTKAWSMAVGEVGKFAMNVETGRLMRV